MRLASVRWLIAIVLLVSLSGCQMPSEMSGFRFPWSKTASFRQRLTPSATAETPPLTTEQKAEIQVAMARGLERQGRTDEAKKVYQEVIKVAPRQADAHHFLALLHDRQGECEVAEGYYRAAVELGPERADVHCDLGYSYYLQERWPEAESELRRAVALDPDLRRAHNNLGLLLARTGRDAEAMHAFAKAGCSEAEAHANLALAFSLAGRWADAQANFERALQIDPQLQTARNGLTSLQSLAAANPPGRDEPPVVVADTLALQRE